MHIVPISFMITVKEIIYLATMAKNIIICFLFICRIQGLTLQESQHLITHYLHMYISTYVK